MTDTVDRSSSIKVAYIVEPYGTTFETLIAAEMYARSQATDWAKPFEVWLCQRVMVINPMER